MTNFEKITQSPEALGEFLSSLPNALIRRAIGCEQPHPPQPHGGGIIKGGGNMRRHSLCVHVDPPW